MTDPTGLSIDDYRDAVALCRATLQHDEDGIATIFAYGEPLNVFQAMTRLYLGVVHAHAAITNQDPDKVIDQVLQRLEEAHANGGDEQ